MSDIHESEVGEELIGSVVGGWRIGSLIGFGKSAGVFEATKGHEQAAIKIFFPSIIKKYGRKMQLERIERERSLIGIQHEHLVRILDGGLCSTTDHHFIVMEKLDGKTLADVFTAVPIDKIGLIISQIAKAAQFLEERGIAHRDIKPSNIFISNDFNSCKLLDLGVIFPIGMEGTGTDADGKRRFVGTLRYASPEFLRGEVENSIDGWRALTFYQIGAVLHDIIMKRVIFASQSDPYAVLVNAVEHLRPKLFAPDVPAALLSLAQNCLTKNPVVRLQVVSWTEFHKLDFVGVESLVEIRDRLRKRKNALELDTETQSRKLIGVKLNEFVDRVEALILAENQAAELPPVQRFRSVSAPRETLCIVYSRSPGSPRILPISIIFLIEELNCIDELFRISVVGAVGKELVDGGGLRDFKPLFHGRADAPDLAEKLSRSFLTLFEKLNEASLTDLANGQEVQFFWEGSIVG